MSVVANISREAAKINLPFLLDIPEISWLPKRRHLAET
jgi:hypothetical protein